MSDPVLTPNYLFAHMKANLFSDICEAGNDCSVNANCISGSSGYTCQCFDNHVDVNNNGRNCQGTKFYGIVASRLLHKI